MTEHTKQALRDYAARQRNQTVTNEAMDRAVNALAVRMYRDYDSYRDDLIERAHREQVAKEMEQGL